MVKGTKIMNYENPLRLVVVLWLVTMIYGIGVVSAQFMPFGDDEVVVS